MYSDISWKYSCDFLKLFSICFFIFVIIKTPIKIGIIATIVSFRLTPLIIWYVEIINTNKVLVPSDNVLWDALLTSVTSFTKYDIISPFFILCISVSFRLKNLLKIFDFKSLSILLCISTSKCFQIILHISKRTHEPSKYHIFFMIFAWFASMSYKRSIIFPIIFGGHVRMYMFIHSIIISARLCHLYFFIVSISTFFIFSSYVFYVFLCVYYIFLYIFLQVFLSCFAHYFFFHFTYYLFF